MLDRGRSEEGETLLVLGAAGGVGLAAVELGKAYGARVIAAASSERSAAARGRRRFTRSSTRAAVRQGQSSCWPHSSRKRSRGGADIIYDPVGGAMPSLRCVDRLGGPLPGARLSRAGIPKLPLNLTLAEELRRARRLLGRLSPRATPRPMPPTCRRCSGCGRRGKIAPRSPVPGPWKQGAMRSPTWRRVRRVESCRHDG
jgi:NADPH:quinone reductase-like Zn-dependent oxidoreductase